MFSLFGQPNEYKCLLKFIQNFKKSISYLSERSNQTSALGESIMQLAKSEAPEYSVYCEPIKEFYDSLAIVYQNSVIEQTRALEDLNDILIRYPILQRKEDEKVKLMNMYNASNKKYKEMKLKFKNNQTQENLFYFKKLQNERIQCAQNVVDKVKECEEYQIKFDKFVENRFRSAWRRFGESFEKACKQEIEILEQLSAFCYKFRDNINTPQKILAKINDSQEEISKNTLNSQKEAPQQNLPMQQQIINKQLNANPPKVNQNQNIATEPQISQNQKIVTKPQINPKQMKNQPRNAKTLPPSTQPKGPQKAPLSQSKQNTTKASNYLSTDLSNEIIKEAGDFFNLTPPHSASDSSSDILSKSSDDDNIANEVPPDITMDIVDDSFFNGIFNK